MGIRIYAARNTLLFEFSKQILKDRMNFEFEVPREMIQPTGRAVAPSPKLRLHIILGNYFFLDSFLLLLGFMLAYGSGDTGSTVTRHMWGGIALSIGLLLCVLARTAASNAMQSATFAASGPHVSSVADNATMPSRE